MRKLFLVLCVSGMMVSCGGNKQADAYQDETITDEAVEQQDSVVVDQDATTTEVAEETPAEEDNSAEVTAEKIKEFYTAYMRNLDKGNISANEALLKANMPTKVKDRLFDPGEDDFLDGDPVTFSQDPDFADFQKSVTVKPIEGKADQYEVKYGSNYPVKILVEATCNDGKLQIMDIKPL